LRVTEQAAWRNAAYYVGKSLERLAQTQVAISSGKRLQRASDDPAAARTVIWTKARIGELEQYKKGISSAESWMAASDNALADAADLLRQARGLALDGANSFNSPDDLRAISIQVEKVIDQVLSLANTKHMSDTYLFAGQDTLNAPFTPAGDPITQVDYTANPGSQNDVYYEVGPGVYQKVNVLGDVAFAGVFGTLIDLRDNLANGEIEAISTDRITELDAQLIQVSTARAEVGAAMNGLEKLNGQLDTAILDLTGVRSDAEDVDLMTAVTELSLRQNQYQASLLASAKILSTSLASILG
jgi:flagellar hook-associated protein 3 FlgL